MQTKITVAEAAARMGVTQQFIRMGLQSERLPFGFAVKMDKRWAYYINEAKFDECLTGVARQAERMG